jgi:hypothetical protein
MKHTANVLASKSAVMRVNISFDAALDRINKANAKDLKLAYAVALGGTADQRVRCIKAELAQQHRGAQLDARSAQPIRTPTAKRGSSGWVPAGSFAVAR